MNQWSGSLVVTAAAAAVLTLSACGAGGTTHVGTAAPPSSVSTTVPVTVKITQDQAIERVTRLTAELSDVTRTDAKLVTVGDVIDASGSSVSAPDLARAQDVWAVAVSGTFVSFGGHGVKYPWALYLVNVDSGDIVGTFAGETGLWPDYWDKLTSMTPAS